jgi:spastin
MPAPPKNNSNQADELRKQRLSESRLKSAATRKLKRQAKERDQSTSAELLVNPDTPTIDHGPDHRRAIVNSMIRPLHHADNQHLVGHEKVKNDLRELLTPTEDKHGVPFNTPEPSILVFGPSGNGKTALIEQAAKTAGSTLFAPTADQLLSAWQGEAEAVIATLFDTALQRQPSIIFLDEIDTVGAERSSTFERNENSTVNTLLQKTDQLRKAHQDARVTFIAATNHIRKLDPALVRRFSAVTFIGRPSPQERVDTIGFSFASNNVPLHLTATDVQWLADATPGHTFAEMVKLARAAAVICLRQHRELTPHLPLRPTTAQHFAEALHNSTTLSSLDDDIKRMTDEDERRSTTKAVVTGDWTNQPQRFQPINFKSPSSSHQTSTTISSSSNNKKRVYTVLDDNDDLDDGISNISNNDDNDKDREFLRQYISLPPLKPVRPTHVAPHKNQPEFRQRELDYNEHMAAADRLFRLQHPQPQHSSAFVNYTPPVQQLQRPESVRPYMCSICSRSFATKGQVQTHLAIPHKRRCRYCSISFINEKQRHLHSQQLHSDQPAQYSPVASPSPSTC